MPTGSSRGNDAAKQLFAGMCKQLGLPHTREKPLHALICGIPNVGKSTFINMLAGRQVAVVGDKPAVTKVQQHVIADSGMILTDTPGLMWPKIEDDAAGFRIALVGSIPDTAIDATRRSRRSARSCCSSAIRSSSSRASSWRPCRRPPMRCSPRSASAAAA